MATSSENKEWQFVCGVMKIIAERLSPENQKASKVVDFHQPEELANLFDVKLSSNGNVLTNDDLLKACEKIVNYSVKTSHPNYLHQLIAGTDAYGLAASLLQDALNTCAYTYDVAPVFTLMEREVLAQIGRLVGYKAEEADGIFTPGGSMANFFGLSIARFNKDKEYKSKGLFGSERLLIFTSDQAHYSVTKGAFFMGFGTDSIVYVKSRKDGSMDPDDLKNKIFESKQNSAGVPFVLWATSGTTVLNAFDPLEELNAIAKEHNMWFHVDACLGGSYLLSEKHRHLLKGSENADSLAWNWHKMLGSPLQTSVFITKHKGVLKAAHSANASYLFPVDKHYSIDYDSGDATIQCGRLTDSVKAWMMCKAGGMARLGRGVDRACEAAQYLAQQLKRNDRFRLVIPEAQGASVTFWVEPPSLKGTESANPEKYWETMGRFCQKLKAKMIMKGAAMVTYQPLPAWNLVNFFRITFHCNPKPVHEDIDKLIATMVELSDDM